MADIDIGTEVLLADQYLDLYAALAINTRPRRFWWWRQDIRQKDMKMFVETHAKLRAWIARGAGEERQEKVRNSVRGRS